MFRRCSETQENLLCCHIPWHTRNSLPFSATVHVLKYLKIYLMALAPRCAEIQTYTMKKR